MMSRAPALEGGDSGREPRLLTAVVYGFTAAVVMWFVGFVTHLPAIGMPAWLVGAVMTLVQLETGVRIGRRYRGGSCAGIALMAGLVTSIINLLIVGAVVATPGKDQPNALQTGWPWVVAGTLAFGPVICLIGSGIGRFERSSRVGAAPTIEKRPWSVDALLSRFAVVCAIAALPVLLSGGIVTSTKSGLAVPDWPTTYRAAMFLYPLADMTGGIYYEHAHRLFGSLVGLCVLTFFVLALVYDRRAKSVSLALIALLAVIGQGVLGGVRVTMASAAAATVGGDASPASTLDNSSSLFLAFVHGITGQLTFGLLVLIAAVLSP
ncbi:MAG TPA: COX15/CtaA family protein, partial [Phycisphaerales bacterium]|nr:COX15/CtaA family protein [Phycisphaerales bacterium]